MTSRPIVTSRAYVSQWAESGSGWISGHRSNLCLWLPIPGPFPAPRRRAPAIFFTPAPLQLCSWSNMFQATNWKVDRFYRASSYAIAVVILYVCPSVFMSHALCDKTKQCTADNLIPRTWKGNIALVFWHVVGWWRPLRLKFALKVAQPLKTLQRFCV